MRAGTALVCAAAALFLAACGPKTGAPPAGEGAALSHAAAPYKVTSSLDCLAQTQSRDSVQLFPIGLADKGRTYDMLGCQAVDVVLSHPGSDGCQWTQIQTSNAVVLAILPLPLPSPPPGGVNEAWIASAPGQATLTSSLACPGGTTTRWAVTFAVTP
jgi:hypothetical protein